MAVSGHLSRKKTILPVIIIFGIVILSLLAIFYGLSKNSQYSGWNFFGSSSDEGVRNCIRSAMSNSPECSDNDGIVKYTTINGRYVGMCISVTNSGECIGKGSASPNCPSGTHQEGSDCIKNSAVGSGLCSSNLQCNNFGSKNCGGAENAVCDSDSLCHCCLLVVNSAASCVSCTGECAGGTHCKNGVCVFDIGGKVSD
jgi:hypothetical protein